MRVFILWTVCDLLWRIHSKNSNHDVAYIVHASVDPSSPFNSYSNHRGRSSSSSSNDFIYSQSYQLNLSPPPESFHGNTTDIQKDNSFVVSNTNKNTKASFDAWIQKFNSKFEKLNVIDLMHDDVDDDNDDDDTDEDDNDGQSSMLSIISLRRKQPPMQLSSTSFSPRVITTRISSSDGKRSNRHRRKRHAEVRTTAVSTLLTYHHNNNQKCPNDSIFRVGRGGSIDGSTVHSHTWISQWLDVAYQSQVGRNLIVSAIVTLVFEAMIGHILEFLKIVMQTSSNSSTDITYLQVIRTITADKGILGLWDGFCPWGIVQAVCKGAVFGLAHATALQTLKPLAEQNYIPMALALTLAGGIGGGFQGYILSPTLLLKTRVMTNPVFREKMSAWRTTLLSFTIGYDVVKKEGLGALMKGANVFATKRVFDWASRYYFADLFEDLFTHLRNGSALSVAEKSAASLLGGVFSTMVTLPLDVLVAKTQDAKKAGIAVSPIKLFQDELREKGWNGIRNAYMRGFEARLLHVCLTTVVIKTGTPIAYEAIFGSK